MTAPRQRNDLEARARARLAQMRGAPLAVDRADPFEVVHESEPMNAPRFTLYSDSEIEELPPLRWQVDGMLPAGGLAAIYGPPGSGKSFLTIDLSVSVATGAPWLGREVLRPGLVVYVAAEGSSGLRQRIAAAKSARDRDGQELGIYFLPECANLLLETECAHLLAAIAKLHAPPALIVIDTLHQSMPGGDENSAKDVGLVIANAHRLRRQTGATVLLVHHSRKDSDVERGSTSLRGAVDSLLYLREDEDRRRLECEKQKDGPKFEPISFRLVPVLDSCVVELADGAGPSVVMTPGQRTALEHLSTDFLDDGASASAWLTVSGLPERSFYRARTELVRKGFVQERPFGRSKRYALTESGRIAANCQPTATQLPGSFLPPTATTATPRRGGSDGRQLDSGSESAA